MARARALRALSRVALYVGITAGTLAALDLTLIALNLFPPTYDSGDAELGWLPSAPTGSMVLDRCIEHSTGGVAEYARNEDAVRTGVSAAVLMADRESFKVAVTGDSQTDLCAPNEDTHAGVLEDQLREHGIPALVFAYGAGRYSPLQDYLVYKKALRKYDPDALILNLYTGNDFYDILRVDDRPYLMPANGGYVIAEPVWYLYDPPDAHYRSRVLFALRSFASRTGLRGLYLRVQFLREVAAERGQGLAVVAAYLNDLRKAMEPTAGYPGAFAAQMLNQQLFFYRFPDARAESVRRIAFLMELVRKENPELLLVMSPIPSYELVQQAPVDEALTRALSRLPISLASGVQEEGGLYEELRRLSASHGWLFADNLPSLRAYQGTRRLYNHFDYHLLPAGSAVVGQVQATVILSNLHTMQTAPSASAGPRREGDGMRLIATPAVRH